MPDVFGPFDGSATQWTQTPWYRDAYARAASGVFGAPAAAVGSGDLPLALNGLSWTVGAGRAHARGAGFERTGAATGGTAATNTNGNARVDRIVLRRNLAAKTVTVERVQGTPAASPVAPDLTQVEDGIWEIPLFRFTVPANSGTTLTNVVDERGWIDPNGAELISCASIAARDANFKTPTAGSTCTVAGIPHTYDGSGWRWQRSFVVSASTDANGSVVATHNLGATPTGVQLTRGSYAADSTTDARVNALGSTTFSFIVANSSGAGLGNNPVTFYATAFV